MKSACQRLSLCIAALTMIVATSSCSNSSGKGGAVSKLAVPTTSAAPPTDSAASSSQVSQTPAPTARIGQTVLAGDEVNSDCSGIPSAAGAPTESGFPTDGSSDGNAPNAGSGEVTQMLPRGVAVITCSTPGALLAVDVPSHTVLWTHPLASSGDSAGSTDYLLSGGGQNVYVLTLTSVAATGLQDSYFTRTVTAIDAKTGSEKWTQALEANDKQSSNNQGSVTEATGPTAGLTEVVVILDEVSTFDAASGKSLWRVPYLDVADQTNDPTFVGYDLTVRTVQDPSGNGSNLVATNARTGKLAWSTPLASDTAPVYGGDTTTELIGQNYWYIGTQGYDAFNILSGHQTAHGLFPTAWTNVVSTPDYTVAVVDGTIRMFKTGQWAKPLWASSAGNVQPVVLTADTVLVSAESGNLLLKTSDGSTIETLDASVGSSNPIVDGLQLQEDGSVFEFATPH